VLATREIVMLAVALIFRPLKKVRRLFFWIIIAYLSAEKLGATIYDMYYHGHYTWIVQYIASIGMAGAVGARFLDIGWQRWLGIVSTLGIALAQPCVALTIAALGIHAAFLSTMPWFANLPAMVLIVLFAVSGSMPSQPAAVPIAAAKAAA
jgi:hypothetical protein